MSKTYLKKPKNLKSFPSHKGPLGGADLRFNSPQPDTSRSCKSTDTGLMCHVGCLFKFPACTGTNLLLGEQRQCVNNLSKVERKAPRPGIEPATSRLQVRRPNHYATMPHMPDTDKSVSALVHIWHVLDKSARWSFALSRAVRVLY